MKVHDVPSLIDRKNKATSFRTEITPMPKVAACSSEERTLLKQTNVPPSNMANELMQQVEAGKDYNYRTLLGSVSDKCIPLFTQTTREPHSVKLIQSKALSPATEAYNNTIASSQITTETTPNTFISTNKDMLSAVSRNTTDIHHGKRYSHNTNTSVPSMILVHEAASSTEPNPRSSKEHLFYKNSFIHQASQLHASIPLIQ